MKTLAVTLLVLLVAISAWARTPYIDFLPGLQSAPTHSIESKKEFLAQDHEDEAHFFAQVSKLPYVEVLRKAARGSQPHLALLFQSALYQDGAGAEGFADTLFWLMHKVGDARFSAALRTQPATVREQVIGYIDFATDYDYSSAFPKTFKLAKHDPQEWRPTESSSK